MAKKILFGILGFVAGFATFVVGFMLTEGLSYLTYPFPEGFKYTHEEICAHVAKYPDGVLGGCAVAWGFTALAAAWVATRIGGRISGVLIALVLGYLFINNSLMLPYPTWFPVAICVGIPMCLIAGILLVRSRRAPPFVYDPAKGH